MGDTALVIPAELILIGALGGGIGAWVRIVVRDEFVARGIQSWRVLLAINLIGSALGGIGLRLTDGSLAWALLVLGFLGGFTTFSSMCVDIVVQWLVGRRRCASIIGFGTMLGGPLLVWIGALAAGGLIAHAATPTVALAPFGRRRMSYHLSGVIGIAFGGFFGTGVRISLQMLAPIAGMPIWTATALVNIVGSGFAGFVFRWLCSLDANGAPRHEPSRRLRIERLLLFGFAGGMTTMSTLSVEMFLAAQESPVQAILIGSVNIGLGVLATIMGWWIAFRCFPGRESFIATYDSHKIS